MKTDLQRIREHRAEIIMESDLWDVINKHVGKRATKCEAKLNRLNVIGVLAGMIGRVNHEVQQGHK